MKLEGTGRVKAGIRDRSNKLVRAVLLEAHRRLVMRTPVRTGRARANWNVGVDKIDRSNNPEKFDKSGRAAIQEGQATILADFKAGDRAFITNSLPYIPPLENGSSKQAPEGMVKVTAAEMRPLVGKVLAEVTRGE